MASSTTSSVGSEIFAASSLIAISALVLLVTRHYLPLRTTPAYLLVPVFLALALPCSIILLVPIDLASADGSRTKHSGSVSLPERIILVTWRITYWLTFSLTWFILPFLGEYCDSGYRDARSRTFYSLRNNARYQLIVVATGAVGLVYFIWEHGFNAETIKGLIMALAYAWGLFLAIGLMGHGLVAMPRRLFKSASVGARLRGYQTQAPRTKDNLDEASDVLEQLEQTVIQLKRHKGGANKEQQEWIDELADTTILPPARPGLTLNGVSSTPNVPAVVTDRYLADLSRRVKRARHRKARFVEEWSNLCDQAQDAQTILDSVASKKLNFSRAAKQWKIITPPVRYQLHMNVLPILRIAFSVILAIASLLILWSELINPIAPKLSVIGYTVVHRPNSESGDKVNFGGQLIAAAWLLYMDASALYAMSDVKVWGNRALVTRKTYAESACWYSLQVAKLTVPLSFNFLTMMPEAVYPRTGFYSFLGRLIDLTPLGERFSAFFPCVLLLPALATLFNLYGKAKSVLGFGILEDDAADGPSGQPGFGTGSWREGRALIERELQSRGADGQFVGLTARGESLDLERGLVTTGGGAAAAASTSTSPPPSRRPGNNEGLAPRAAALTSADPRVRDANRQFRAVTGARSNEEEDDESPRHFYQDIGERLRNTFDTTERPEWVRNFSFKKPKWMQNDEAQGNGEEGSAFSRWFGGRAEDGRVRL